MLLRSLASAAAVGIAILLVKGCFYDSRWGEIKRAQQHNAAHFTPQAIHAGEPSADADGRARTVRTFRVRFLATAAYTAQTPDWARRVHDLVDDANAILEPSFHARLDIDAVKLWSDAEGQKGLADALKQLEAADAGDDVDWVVGLVGGLSQLTTSFHELGMAPLLSKHLVMRATAQLDEHDLVDQAFDELKEEDRVRFRRERRRHRVMAIFLHELGHTLGAVHEPNTHSLMYPRYGTDMEMYDEGAADWIRLSFTHRTDHHAVDDPEALAKEGVPSLRRASNWVPEARDELVTYLEKWALSSKASKVERGEALAAPSEPATADAHAAAPSVPTLPADAQALPEADRTLFSDALAARTAGDTAKAWTTGTPLFRKYSTVYSVQDLRCQLAMNVLAWSAARAECDPLMKLARDPRRTK